MTSLLSPADASLAVDAVTPRLSGGSIVVTGDGKTLVTLRLGRPAFLGARNGEAFARPIAVGRVVAAGEPSRFAVLDDDGVTVISGTVGNAEEDDLTLSERRLTPGEEVFIASCRYIQETA
jgi:hypothetical protein